MTLRLTDMLARARVEVAPAAGATGLTLFVCGESAHDAPNLEYARQAVFFDALVRHLRRGGVPVTLATAWMDTDDRLAVRAKLEGRPAAAIAAETANLHEAARLALRVAPPDRLLAASAARREAERLRDLLVERGCARVEPSGVHFRAASYAGYGELSGQRGEMLLAAPGDAAGDPLDFPVWRADGASGAPTWHLECPALTLALLGPRVDLHGSCAESLFPHDENSRAIMESAFGAPFARVWCHVGPIVLAARDASAGRTRLFRLPELFAVADPRDVRFYLMSHHYRKPMSFEPERIAAAAASRGKLARFLEELGDGGDAAPPEDVAAACRGAWEALDDDFNAPRALGLLHVLRKRVRARADRGAPPFGRRVAACARELLAVLLGED